MYKKVVFMISFLAVLSLVMAPTALASESDPILDCPKTGYELMQWMPDHQMHHDDHLHLVIEGDVNGDGWICVKHSTTPKGEVHIHIDNSGLLTK